MDDRLIDEYIRASLKDIEGIENVVKPAIAATPETAPKNPVDSEENMGGLIVAVTTLRGLREVSGAEVTVFTGTPNARQIVHRELTDDSGKTDVIPLKTKSRTLSETEGSTEVPYLTYNVSVLADGFVEQMNLGLPIFEGVVSIQNVDLTSKSASNGNPGPIIFDVSQSYNL